MLLLKKYKINYRIITVNLYLKLFIVYLIKNIKLIKTILYLIKW
jgi:hypothetical protein